MQETTVKTYPHQYIEITESGMGIINDKTSKFIKGFYTTGLDTCVGIASFGVEDKKDYLTFIHYDSGVSTISKDIIEKGLNWITKDNSKTIIISKYKPNELPSSFDVKLFNFLNNNSSIIYCNCYGNPGDRTPINFLINRDGEIKFIKKENILQPIFSNQIHTKVRLNINKINRALVKDNELELQFNENNYTKLPKFQYYVKNLIINYLKSETEEEKFSVLTKEMFTNTSSFLYMLKNRDFGKACKVIQEFKPQIQKYINLLNANKSMFKEQIKEIEL